MLTKADRTVADALAVLDDIRLAGLRHIGCKEGCPRPPLSRAALRRRERPASQGILLSTAGAET